MKFNFYRTLDFPPQLVIKGFNDQIKVISETKLLGIILTNDLKWAANTVYLCKKAYKNMWKLRRMKLIDVEPLVLLDVYIKDIRCVVELAVPAWHSGLTTKQAADIERIQRIAVYIILSDCITGRCDFNYDMALVALDLEPLDVRRELLCLSFAKKTLKSRHSDIFSVSHQYNTRNKPKFVEQKARKTRNFKSPVNYLTRLLNDN